MSVLLSAVAVGDGLADDPHDAWPDGAVPARDGDRVFAAGASPERVAPLRVALLGPPGAGKFFEDLPCRLLTNHQISLAVRQQYVKLLDVSFVGWWLALWSLALGRQTSGRG